MNTIVPQNLSNLSFVARSYEYNPTSNVSNIKGKHRSLSSVAIEMQSQSISIVKSSAGSSDADLKPILDKLTRYMGIGWLHMLFPVAFVLYLIPHVPECYMWQETPKEQWFAPLITPLVRHIQLII